MSTDPRVGEKGLLGGLLQDQFNPAAIQGKAYFFWNDQRVQTSGTAGGILIKTYVTGPATVQKKGLGYGYREVHHHLAVDVQGGDDQNTWNAKEEVKRVLGANRKAPFTGYNEIDFDEGAPRPGYGGYYRYVFEVKLIQYRKEVAT